MNDQDFDKLLQRVLTAPRPSAGLQDRLLALAGEPVLPAAAANDSLWRRVLPVAASMAALLLLAWRYHPVQNAALQEEILHHVYAEERFLDRNDHVALADLNSRMQQKIKARLASSPATDQLDVRFAKDCWVARQTAMHLILQGETGPVSVMMIPSKMVERETAISDDRFSGTITPVGNNTLVVLGNRRERLRNYSKLMAESLEWEY